MRENADEVYALSQLQAYLESRMREKFQCAIKVDDPPDIDVQFENGERWGVEVTRTYPIVIHSKGGHAVAMPRLSVSEPLWKLIEEIESETEGRRKFAYTLYLDGPPLSTKWSQWRRDVKKEILAFLSSGREERHEFVGGNVSASRPGSGLFGMVGSRPDAQTIGGHSANIDLNIEVMLRDAFQRKATNPGLIARKADYDQIWLLLLNGYPFAHQE